MSNLLHQIIRIDGYGDYFVVNIEPNEPFLVIIYHLGYFYSMESDPAKDIEPPETISPRIATNVVTQDYVEDLAYNAIQNFFIRLYDTYKLSRASTLVNPGLEWE